MVDLSDRVKIGTKTVYYKYNSWTQPVLITNTSSSDMWLEDPKLSGATANSEGIDIEVWGSSKGYDFSDAFHLFNNNSLYSQSYIIKDNNYDVIDICFSNYMNLSNLEISSYKRSSSVGSYKKSTYINNIICYKVDENGLTKLASQTINSYTGNFNLSSNNKVKRLRICFNKHNISSSYWLYFKNITITGTKAEESTSSNYDFTEDKQIGKTICDIINPTYSGIILEGNITRHNNMLSGFSNNSLVNYAKFKEPFNPVGNDFEICIGFKTADNVATGNNQTIFNSNGATNNEYRGIVLHLGANGKLVVGSTNSDNSGWIASIYGPVAATNTKYWLKAVRDNGYLKGYYSTDNENWTLIDTKTLDFNYTPFTQSYLGNRYQPATVVNKLYDCFDGEIDLSTSYIKINGSYWWSGAKANAKMFYV